MELPREYRGFLTADLLRLHQEIKDDTAHTKQYPKAMIRATYGLLADYKLTPVHQVKMKHSLLPPEIPESDSPPHRQQ